jgi:hypothetical protein
MYDRSRTSGVVAAKGIKDLRMENRNIQIRNTVADDLSWIFDWFDHSIAFHERKALPTWKNYDQGAIRRDIEKSNQYKILIESQPAMVFSVYYEDKVIWREREKGVLFICIVL